MGIGTGLGLSTVMGIVKSHDGFIDVYSEVGKGTGFGVYLPAAEKSVIQTTKNLALLKGNGELILVVEDEAAIRSITKTTLETHNYRVLTASDGIEALAVYAQHEAEISLVLRIQDRRSAGRGNGDLMGFHTRTDNERTFQTFSLSYWGDRRVKLQ